MRISPNAAVSCALVMGLGLATLALLAPAPSLAQSSDAAARVVDPDASADVLRARGASAWRNYVWSLDRPRLAHAVSELERARALNGGRADFTQVYLIAFGELVLGNVEAGGAAAAEVRASAPEFAPNLLLDAFEAINAGEHEKAHEQLTAFVTAIESTALDPAFGHEFRYLAYLHRAAQRYDMGLHGQAVSDYRNAVRIAREADRQPATSVMLRLALAHQALDEHGAAAELIQELLRRDPANADLYHNMGLLEGTQKHLPEARAWYERATARRPNHAEAHSKLGFLAWQDAEIDPAELRRTRRQLAAYRALVRDNPRSKTLADVESGHGLYWLSVARHRIDRALESSARSAYEQAVFHFERALEHEPGCIRALNGIIQIGGELGWPEERLGPLRERMNAILRDDEGAPASHRSSFC